MRFTSVDLLASVAPERPGWQRHLPPSAALLPSVLLGVAFAQPAAERAHAEGPRHRHPRPRHVRVDGATDVSPDRLDAAQAAARSFVDSLPKGLQVGLLSFDKSARLVVRPTTDRAAVQAGIDALQLGPGTATGPAITWRSTPSPRVPPAPTARRHRPSSC